MPEALRTLLEQYMIKGSSLHHTGDVYFPKEGFLITNAEYGLPHNICAVQKIIIDGDTVTLVYYETARENDVWHMREIIEFNALKAYELKHSV